ncbi:hypothetical protein [Anaerofustis stercorihominis]|uniref:Uncharacterized protein n=1 Tax=Anaerofustis stercorihominis TaxID=214853 RepID=A0A3E3DUN4_9FIRM|nr:hypothetical protein [Anaerofustis stercorihominis]RGD72941.1 hypothetical protein DW687_11925 [Anaerofustis stercorihominis]
MNTADKIIYLPSGQGISLEELNEIKDSILSILSDRNFKIIDIKSILEETIDYIDIITQL